MNPFFQKDKKSSVKPTEKVKIKSKYFGEYEPQLFIASRSKSKSRSPSKDDHNNFILKSSSLSSLKNEFQALNHKNNNYQKTINPQTAKSPRYLKSENVSEYFLQKNTTPREKKDVAAIEKIIEWVERKYFQKLRDQEIQGGTQMSILRKKFQFDTNQSTKSQEKFKKLAYDSYIIRKLKGSFTVKPDFSTKTIKQNDIDSINVLPKTQSQKAEDFDIYKFKKNQNNLVDDKIQRIANISINKHYLNQNSEKKEQRLTKVANHLILTLNKKIKNETGLCQLDYWPNAVFHQQNISKTMKPIEINALNIYEQNQEILNQIFQMNHSQQNILKNLNSKENSVLLRENKSESQISKPKISLAQNYFLLHLDVKEIKEIKTYEMPLVKANTNMISQRLSNKQLNPQVTKNSHNKNSQTSTFAQNYNLFSTICGRETLKYIQRGNYFTEAQVSGRDRVTSVNSNQSKKSSKPKVSFNYISPSQKNIPNLTQQQGVEGSLLFKNQSSHLKNTGKAPVKIEIKPSQEIKRNGEFSETITGQICCEKNRKLRSFPQMIELKQRSKSASNLAFNKVVLPQHQFKQQNLAELSQTKCSKKPETKNTFISTGYGPSYYRSQKTHPKFRQTQILPTQINYQSAQSYYFPNTCNLNMIKTQKGKIGVQSNKKIFKKDSSLFPKIHLNYLYPIKNLVQKQRTERAKSLCEKISVTVKKIEF